MILGGARFWKGLKSDHLMTLLRVTLGVIFVIGGLKLAFPPLFGVPGHETLAQGYIDPAKGWIEMLIGLLLILGIFTSAVAVGMGLLLLTFALANPAAGEVWLSRDIALLGLCFAVALSGATTWSLDRIWLRRSSRYHRYRDIALLLIRLSLAYPLIASALFSGGVLNDPLNTTLPSGMALVLGVLLAVGVMPHWMMLVLGLWMLYVVPESLWAKGLLAGLHEVKNEMGILFASLFYFLAGPDRWSYPRPSMLMCRNVVDLVMSYLEGTLETPERRAFEAHIADCTNCWRFLKSYRHTVELGQSLREEDIPTDVRRRLEAFVRNRPARS